MWRLLEPSSFRDLQVRNRCDNVGNTPLPIFTFPSRIYSGIRELTNQPPLVDWHRYRIHFPEGSILTCRGRSRPLSESTTSCIMTNPTHVANSCTPPRAFQVASHSGAILESHCLLSSGSPISKVQPISTSLFCSYCLSKTVLHCSWAMHNRWQGFQK